MMYRDVLLYVCLLLPLCAVAAEAADDTQPQQPTGITDVAGMVVDQSFVRLSMTIKEPKSPEILMYRQTCDHIRIRQFGKDVVEALKAEASDLVFQGSLEVDAQGLARWEDHDVKPQLRYAYWIASSADGPKLGPIILRVRHPDVWFSLERLQAESKQLAEQYPDLVEVVTFGKSLHGRPITGVVIGNRDTIYSTTGNIHAGEWGNGYIIDTAKRLLKNDPELFKKVGYIGIPVVNVDMYHGHIIGYPRYQRKAAPANLPIDFAHGFPPFLSGWHPTYVRGGVDLNRNFPTHWEIVSNDYGTKSDDPSAGTYRGPAPLSQPENRAVQNLLVNYKPKVHIDHHGALDLLFMAEEVPQDLRQQGADYAEAFYRGFFYDNKKVEKYIKLNLMAPDRWPGSVMHYGASLGIVTFTTERTNKGGLGKKFLQRFKDGEQTPADIAEGQERNYRATRAIMMKMAQGAGTE